MRSSIGVFAISAALAVAGCSSTEPPGPTVPTGVTAKINGGTIDLQWNSMPGAIGYKVYMAEVGGVTATNVTTLTGNMTHLELPPVFKHPAGLPFTTRFYFVVTAIRSDSTETSESCEVHAKIGTNEATSC